MSKPVIEHGNKIPQTQYDALIVAAVEQAERGHIEEGGAPVKLGAWTIEPGPGGSSPGPLTNPDQAPSGPKPIV
jgi:hypothetical protein